MTFSTRAVEEQQDEHDMHMLRLSKQYSKVFTVNVYKLNKCALSIQHWYFRAKYAQLRRE